MAGPSPPPFNPGRLAAIFFGIAVFVIGTWLVVRSQPEPEAGPERGPVPMVRPEPPPIEQPIAVYLARADAARGEPIYARCAACHTIDAGGRHGVGPNLHGVMGSALASRPGFESYSDALRQKGGRWDWETASAFLRSPRHFVPGTRMGFGGIEDPQQRADLLLYLNREGGSLTVPAAAH